MLRVGEGLSRVRTRKGVPVEPRPSATPDLMRQIEDLLIELVQAVAPARRPGPGRPVILPAMLLWVGLTVCVLRGFTSQLALWRLLTAKGLWQAGQVVISDEAVYRRLGAADPGPLAEVFGQLTALLTERVAPWQEQGIAPFATEVVVLDETTLDPVARTLPALRERAVGDHVLLPGTIAGLYDVRRQLWRAIQVRADPHQNEKVVARDLVADLPAGALILADLGYFGFAWFDDLTDAGQWWISRMRKNTTYTVEHTYYQNGATLDALVWLGSYRADRAKYLVRMVRFRHGEAIHSYITNVTDPQVLSIREIAELYARRWDIEMAVKVVKRDLKLHLLWSAKPVVVLHQVWAVLLIAQIVQALRLEIAGRAGVDTLEVSIPLLIQYLPQYSAQGTDPIEAFVHDGRRLGFIRPVRRVPITAPAVAHEQLSLPPPDLQRTRVPRYGTSRRHALMKAAN